MSVALVETRDLLPPAPRPPGRRTLGGWRRKVATPEVLLTILWPARDIVTDATKTALTVLAAAP